MLRLMRLCRVVTPLMAYTSPATYSCLMGLRSSNSRYASTDIRPTGRVRSMGRAYARLGPARNPPVSVQPVLLDLPVQRALADPQPLGGAPAIALGLPERRLDG